MPHLRTLTKRQLTDLLAPFPDQTPIEITVCQSDLDRCTPEYAGEKVYCFGLPGDFSTDNHGLALAVWSEEVKSDDSALLSKSLA